MDEQRKHVAVIGGGWAGCAAAAELALDGCRVTIFEAGRVLGGRARRTELNGLKLDNGQHILLGAYSESLRLIRAVGVDPAEAFLRLPLQMRYPAGSGGMDFATPRLPAPLHLAAGLLRAGGLNWSDRQALMRFFTAARWMGWTLHEDCSVAELLERFDQTGRLIRLLWRPLCIAALNTMPESASAQVFLAVLRDSLGARRAASDMLLPRIDLSALLPEPAGALVERLGGAVLYGRSVRALRRDGSGWRVDTASTDSGDIFDAVVVATPAVHAASLLAPFVSTDRLPALDHEPIATCYLQYPAHTRLAQPFHALKDDFEAGDWGQYVFDRGHFFPDQAGLLAVVVSVASAADGIERERLQRDIAIQLARDFRRPELAQPVWSRLITERRATICCTPALARPKSDLGVEGLALAGDYTESEYPATLESAVRSGVRAARLVREMR